MADSRGFEAGSGRLGDSVKNGAAEGEIKSIR